MSRRRDQVAIRSGSARLNLLAHWCRLSHILLKRKDSLFARSKTTFVLCMSNSFLDFFKYRSVFGLNFTNHPSTDVVCDSLSDPGKWISFRALIAEKTNPCPVWGEWNVDLREEKDIADYKNDVRMQHMVPVKVRRLWATQQPHRSPVVTNDSRILGQIIFECCELICQRVFLHPFTWVDSSKKSLVDLG